MKLRVMLAVGMVAALGAVTPALAIDIVSDTNTPITCGAGDPTCVAGTATEITPHPAWQTEAGTNPLAQWISYADTGFGGGHLAPQKGSATNPLGTTIMFSVALTLGDGALNMLIWADDTADVYVNNVLVKAANFTDDVCADGSIGCEPGEAFNLVTALAAGVNTVRMDFFQFGSVANTTDNPFGALFSGTLTPVPEPASMLLLGTGLLGLAARRRAKKNKN